MLVARPAEGPVDVALEADFGEPQPRTISPLVLLTDPEGINVVDASILLRPRDRDICGFGWSMVNLGVENAGMLIIPDGNPLIIRHKLLGVSAFA